MGYITLENYDELIGKLYAIQKQLVGLIKTIRTK